jgi:16S rRNA (adenine1518-N6/adenine1519-N6)-dimethyltransferase
LRAHEGYRRLRASGSGAKRSFGQRFLHDEGLCRRIAELATTPPGGIVLEIGAGLGSLTEGLCARASKVVAVERDRELVPLLGELFAAEVAAGTLEIREADAARLDWAALLALGPAPRVLCGNLPYQITGKLIEKAVGQRDAVDRVVVMVQREVADRLAAAPGTADYGALSVFTQAAFTVRRAIAVPRGAFVPAPRVDSAVVVLEPAGARRAAETPAFRAVVKAAFTARRKTLRNAWRGLADRAAVDAAAARAGIDLGARGETLAVEDFARMAAALSE